MPSPFAQFRAAILDLIALRQSRQESLVQPNRDLEAELACVESAYVDLVDMTTPTDRDAIGDFYREALEVFGSNEELFQQYPDAAGLLMALRFEGAREQIRGLLNVMRHGKWRAL